jgi:hypothetical protein
MGCKPGASPPPPPSRRRCRAPHLRARPPGTYSTVVVRLLPPWSPPSVGTRGTFFLLQNHIRTDTLKRHAVHGTPGPGGPDGYRWVGMRGG